MKIVAYEVTYYSPDFEKSADKLVTKKKFRKLPEQISESVAFYLLQERAGIRYRYVCTSPC